MNKTALILLVEGFEEIEAICPIDLLRRAEVNCTIASTEDTLLVTGRDGIIVKADVLLESIIDKDFDSIIVPGGPGYKRMRKDDRVMALLKQHAAKGRITGAICAAPTLLSDAGLLNGKRYTSHPSVVDDLQDPVSNQAVVVDGDIITSRGAGTATEFALALVAKLTGKEKAEKIAESICFPHQRVET
jgi:4-methyl-5(b-hydroxyethyl)-thiazole monophosphate biosynthesis